MSRATEEDHLIIGSQLRKAREAVGLSHQDVATRIGRTAEEVEAWEAERTEPEAAELEELAAHYGREIDYFLHRTAEEPARYEFRVTQRADISELSPEARMTISRFEELCRISDTLESLLGKHRERKLPRATENETASHLAKRQREIFGWHDKPIRGLRENLGKIGVRVFELPVPSDEFSGLSSPNSSLGPRILVNAHDGFGRRHFTLAHEFGHLLYRHKPSVCQPKGALEHAGGSPERQADRLAVELLLPRAPIVAEFRAQDVREFTVRELGQLASRWRVSLEAMGYRLEELDLLEEGSTRRLLAGPAPKMFFRGGRPRWERRLGREFVADALAAYRAQQISLGRVAALFGISVRQAHDLAHGKAKPKGR